MSSIQFYKDNKCLEVADLGNSTGPPSGQCTQFGESEWQSFRVVTLERTCAVTIYDRDVEFCSSSKASIASFGACTTNATVNQFSIDCQDYNIATSDTPASYIPPASTTTTRSTVPSSEATALPDASTDAGMSNGAKAAIGICTAALILLLIGLGIFFIVRRRRRATQSSTISTPAVSELRGDGHYPAEVPPHYTQNHLQHYETKKLPRTPNAEPVEAPGDDHWHGPHEMESPSVTTATETRSNAGGLI